MSLITGTTTIDPLVSVVIPCFNSQDFIEETLESVFAQKGVRFEVVAIDDGSTDGTASLIQERFPQVKLTRTGNHGASAARQLGTSLAQGDFIQYLDADDLLCPGKLQTQVAALCSEGADVAYGDFQKFQTFPDGSARVIEHAQRNLGEDPECDLFFAAWCPPAVYLIRRTIVERVGSWHRNLPVIQDARFMVDCAYVGARFVHCPGVMAQYRTGSENSLSVRNRPAFLRDCFTNLQEVMERWSQTGAMSNRRRWALIDAAHHVAWGSVETELFDQACDIVTRLGPGGPSGRGPWKRAAARLLGYRRMAVSFSRARKVRAIIRSWPVYRHSVQHT